MGEKMGEQNGLLANYECGIMRERIMINARMYIPSGIGHERKTREFSFGLQHYLFDNSLRDKVEMP